jgi:dGTPase
MHDHGGFEHNLQSLRVVDELEEKYAEFPGLNLTYETREGILKHCSLAKAAELGELGRRFLDKQQPSLEAQVTDLADAIAYNSHDVDDGLRAGLITIEQLDQVDLFREQHKAIMAKYPGLSQRRTVHEVVRRIINAQVVDLIETSQGRIAALAPADIDAVRQAGALLIAFSPSMFARHLQLKQFLRRHMYRHYRVYCMAAKAQRVVQSLFHAYFQDRRLLPEKHYWRAKHLEQEQGRSGRARAVADYIAGMTDRFAIAEYARLFDPGQQA